MAELDAALAELVGPTEPSTTAAASPTTSLVVAESNLAAGRSVQRARPTIAAITVVGVLLMAGMAADLLGRFIAHRAELGAPSGTEGGLVVVGVLAAIATPTGLWIRFLRRRVWHNSLRAVALARRTTAVVASAAASYAGVLLVARLLDLGFVAEPSASAGLVAAITASAAASLATIVAVLATRPARRERAA